jgi:hypothetical protein
VSFKSRRHGMYNRVVLWYSQEHSIYRTSSFNHTTCYDRGKMGNIVKTTADHHSPSDKTREGPCHAYDDQMSHARVLMLFAT